MNVDYCKRKNTDLFKCLESRSSLYLSNTQNYIPIYKKFFSLNDTNYNGINLNNKWYIKDIINNNENDLRIGKCIISNYETNKIKKTSIFFKIAPLLDPYKYLIGKYDISNENIFQLPKLDSTEMTSHSKFIDENNSAYVDGFFVYLTSNLMNSHNFPHGLNYYGSFLSIKNDFKIDVIDDIDFLINSPFFNKHKNSLFTIEDYEYLFIDEEKLNKKPLIIDYNSSSKSYLSVASSLNNDLYDNIFEDSTINLDDLKEKSCELEDITNENILENYIENNNHITLHSTTTCSSRSSYTDNNNEDSEEENEENDFENNEDGVEEEDVYSDVDDDDETEDDNESSINVTIPKFPVEIICMENCENTFDDLILSKNIKTDDEWYSAFMQIIMILLTYQKVFHFTHNDLHTNNIMYNKTNKKFLFYYYNNKYYKVPTFGRIYKIIDFGRSIFKFDGKIFCSDSFQSGGDAASQYNIEPYFNNDKPRLEPNYSFDLCRLACSIFDYLIDDIREVKDLDKCNDSVKKLIVEWCMDDKGINILYKNNGQDRYPDFKLYKMIARCVHNHTPHAQLERAEFNKYTIFTGEIPPDIINIDTIPCYAYSL
jgi:hypothetical protein